MSAYEKIDIRFSLDIEPHAKGRPRYTGKGWAYTPLKTRVFEENFILLAEKYKPENRIEGPICLHVTSIFSRPKRLMGRKHPKGLIFKTTKPDIDNVAKTVMDSLKGFWFDDNQVCSLFAAKYYAEIGGNSRIAIRLTRPIDIAGESSQDD